MSPLSLAEVCNSKAKRLHNPPQAMHDSKVNTDLAGPSREDGAWAADLCLPMAQASHEPELDRAMGRAIQTLNEN